MIDYGQIEMFDIDMKPEIYDRFLIAANSDVPAECPCARLQTPPPTGPVAGLTGGSPVFPGLGAALRPGPHQHVTYNLIDSVFSGKLKHGFYVFHFGLVEQRRGVHDVAAVLAAIIDKLFTVRPNVIGIPGGQQRIG